MIDEIIQGLHVAEISIEYKSKVKPKDRPQVVTAYDAYKVFEKSWNEHTMDLMEEFKVIFLNNGNKVLGICSFSVGGITSTCTDLRLVYATALKLCACGIIICHNHPSGSLKPSVADKQLTERFRQAGKLLDIVLLDHLLISSGGYYSFADKGAL
jgi:DNA repair protein RadC